MEDEKCGCGSVRDAVALDPPRGRVAGDPWRYCAGCGDVIVGETIAATHGGSSYCQGCEEAPAEAEDAD